MAAALLYAGPGALLSHGAAAWVWQLIPTQPSPVDVRTARRQVSVPGVRVHGQRDVERGRRGRWPVTTIPQTLLDLAPQLPRRELRRALAEAEFLRLLDVAAIEAALGRGQSGSRNLRRALRDHLPLLARTLSPSEDLFLELCEKHGIPLPEVNVMVIGFKVDALWRKERVVVELDSKLAHGQPGQVERDRARDLALRQAGFTILRYTWHQVSRQSQRLAADLVNQLNQATMRPRG